MCMIGWVGFLIGCVPSKVQVQAAPQFDPSSISRLAILPFQALQTPQWGYGQTRDSIRDPEEIRSQFRLPGADQVRTSGSSKDLYSVSDSSAKFITSRVESKLRSRPALEVIGAEESGALPSNNEVTMASLRGMAQEVGGRLHVDGVLVGMVRTYREREGTRMGAKPAAVGFEIFLVRSSDGAVLWKGEFFEEQKPLTEDVVGFFEKSGGFVTAQELSEIGVQKVLDAFPVGKTDPSSR